ncbi:hypothetical protein, partial [Mesorhizobium sp. M2C.T.Ca.TU.002.02.1.1]|uniref:hypothetical protein n=1 Tax=Mesorhizobium sp. M2C.T.Ca.TU.002.02.1.1 TaxID=2496788 RepID=UPI0013E29696
TIGGPLTISATSAGIIHATLVAVTASVAVGSGTVTLSMSAAVALASNSISSDVLAAIETSVVDASGAVDITATNSKDIDAVSVGVAIAVSVGSSASISAALAFSKATNAIMGSTEALITQSSVTADGSVALTLEDTSSITSDVIAASVSVAVSGGIAGVGLAVLVALGGKTISGSSR